MAELNNTAWLEEYIKMWTTKERIGRIHKVTTFDPTYHCYPEGVYLLDDDCRAHTAIYVVDKCHNIHIIYDGMAWDLLARAVEEGANSIVLQLEKNAGSLSDILKDMLKAHNACCAGIQEKLKTIGDQLKRIGDSADGLDKNVKRLADNSDSIKDDIKNISKNSDRVADNSDRIADDLDHIAENCEGGGKSKNQFFARPDRHAINDEQTVYTSEVVSVIDGEAGQRWHITDDFATYPEWATVSTDKEHVYVTTDGSKPGPGTNDPWDVKKTEFYAQPDAHKVEEGTTVYTSEVVSVIEGEEEQHWRIKEDVDTFPEWATVSTDKRHVYVTTDGSRPGEGGSDPFEPGGGETPEPGTEPGTEPQDTAGLWFIGRENIARETVILNESDETCTYHYSVHSAVWSGDPHLNDWELVSHGFSVNVSGDLAAAVIDEECSNETGQGFFTFDTSGIALGESLSGTISVSFDPPLVEGDESAWVQKYKNPTSDSYTLTLEKRR